MEQKQTKVTKGSFFFFSFCEDPNGAGIVAGWDLAANRSPEDPVIQVLTPAIDSTVR